MAFEPFLDKSKGRWRRKWWAGTERGWVTVTLAGHPGARSKDKPPKRPPPGVQKHAAKSRDLETQAGHGVDVVPMKGHELVTYRATYRARFARSNAPGSLVVLDRATRLFLAHGRYVGSNWSRE